MTRRWRTSRVAAESRRLREGSWSSIGQLELGSAGRDTEEDNGGDDDNSEARDQRGAEGDLEVEAPEINGGPSVAIDANPEVLVPPTQQLVFRLRAKVVKHPALPTRAQIERHALEQHVNYEPWCPHCLQASALMKPHPLVFGESPSMLTVSADFCFMKGRDADSGDGILVLVMRESQTRSIFSHACAGKSTSREGYSRYLIEKCIEDIDRFQKDVHLKTDQEPAMLAFQARVHQARKNRTKPTNFPPWAIIRAMAGRRREFRHSRTLPGG